MEIAPDEEKVLLAMIQIEDHGHGAYELVPEVAGSIRAKGLEKYGKATLLARELLGMPKPPPTGDEIAALRHWIENGEAAGWQIEALNRRGLLDPFGGLTDAGRVALSQRT